MSDSPRPHDPSDTAPDARDDRDLDVVLYGATGFVGRLVAAHLAEHAPDGVRIGLAGRSLERVDAVKAELANRAVYWKVLHADAKDTESLAAMARRAKVVISTVGPYAQHGLPLVEACAQAGTDYVDLTGESLFVRESIDACDETAKNTGARIVHSCGFDSVPSDLGVYLTWRKAKEDVAGDLLATTLYVTSLKGGLSGGTIASIVGQIDAMKERPELRKLLSDPYALSPDRDGEPSSRRDRAAAPARADEPVDEPAVEAPDGEPVEVAAPGAEAPVDPDPEPRPTGPRVDDRVSALIGAATGLLSKAGRVAGGVARGATAQFTTNTETGGYTAPFIMGPFNAQVVRRSNALMSWSYGRDFRYRELVSMGKDGAAPLRAAAMAAALPAGLAGFAFGPTRALLDKVVTKPGDGPSDQARKEGRFTMQIHATTTSGAKYVTTVSAQADPGYDATAVMIGQAALALACDELSLPKRHGVLTPATGIGDPLVERLRAQGFTLDVERVER